MANEQQKITLSASPQGGSYRITFDGEETADISYDANAAAVQSALEALSNIGSGNVSVGISGLEITITFTGSLGGANQPEVTVSSSTLCRNTIETLSLSATPVSGNASVKAVGFGGSPGTVYYYDSASAIETALETAGYPSGTGVSGNWNPDGFTISTPADVTLDITIPSFEDAGTNPLTPSYVKTQSYSSVTATVSTIQDGSEPPIMIVHAPAGLTLTAKVFERGSDTLVETVTLTERTNCKGMYEGDLAANESGWHDLSIFSGATCVGIQVAYLTTNPVEHYAGDYCGIEDPSGLLATVGPSAASIRNAVGLASANLDTQLNGTATTATAIKTRTDLLPTVAAGLANGLLTGSGTGTVTLTSGGVVRANDANGAAIATAASVPTLAGIASTVASAITADHGSGSYTTANVSSLATTSQLASSSATILAAIPSISTLATTSQLEDSVVALLTQVNLAIATSAAILDDTGTSGVVVAAASKTGYGLASDGLDSISTTAPSGAASNFRQMVVQTWRRLFKKTTLTSTQLKTYADDGTTVVTTQAVTNTGGTETVGNAS